MADKGQGSVGFLTLVPGTAVALARALLGHCWGNSETVQLPPNYSRTGVLAAKSQAPTSTWSDPGGLLEALEAVPTGSAGGAQRGHCRSLIDQRSIGQPSRHWVGTSSPLPNSFRTFADPRVGGQSGFSLNQNKHPARPARENDSVLFFRPFLSADPRRRGQGGGTADTGRCACNTWPVSSNCPVAAAALAWRPETCPPACLPGQWRPVASPARPCAARRGGGPRQPRGPAEPPRRASVQKETSAESN